MGIGLCEYRAAIGAFAWIASNVNLIWRRKSKQYKARELKDTVVKEGTEKGETSNLNKVQLRKRSRSWDGWRRRSVSRHDGERAKSEKRSRIDDSLRSRSLSQRRGRENNFEESADNFKNACVACKTEMFTKRWRRGRAHRRIGENLCCSHGGDGTTKEEETLQLQIFTYAAVSVCLLVELLQAIFTIIQMLLIRAGIETTPGPPTTSTSSPCCNAVQHFNRVKKTIARVQNNFTSKVFQDTLTKQVIKVKETGRFCLQRFGFMFYL